MVLTFDAQTEKMSPSPLRNHTPQAWDHSDFVRSLNLIFLSPQSCSSSLTPLAVLQEAQVAAFTSGGHQVRAVGVSSP